MKVWIEQPIILSGSIVTLYGEMSLTDQQSVTDTRTHDQGDTHLCWLYSSVSSIRQSLKIKIGKDEN